MASSRPSRNITPSSQTSALASKDHVNYGTMNNGHGAPHSDNVARSRILLLGMRRSGKSSILEVLFKDLPPKQTFYLEMTTRVSIVPYDTVVPIEIWDSPGTISLDTLDIPLSQFQSLIFVIDIQDLYQQPIAKLVEYVEMAYQENPNMHLEVFVHKADALSEEYKVENFRHIQQRVLDELLDISPEFEQLPINFYLTSIYDHSLHDAFSRTLHKLIDSLPYLEDLLNVFCANSQASKAFLFDVNSRLFVATDASPVDPPTHAVCSDYLDMLRSFGPLYRSTTMSPPRYILASSTNPVSLPPSVVTSANGSTVTSVAPTPTAPISPTLPSSPIAKSPQSSTLPALSVNGSGSGASTPPSSEPQPPKALFYPTASTSLSPPTSSLPSSNHVSSGMPTGTALTYHLLTPSPLPPLALVSLLPTAVWEARRGLVEYNVVFLREGVGEICVVEGEARKVV